MRFADEFSEMATRLFSTKSLQKMAGETDFYKRKSDFTPAMFFDVLLYCANSNEPCSLDSAATRLNEIHGVNISKQSVDARFNKGAVVYVQEILTRVLEQQLSSVFQPLFLPQFNRICIKDGTRFNLPVRLKDYYNGFGGTNDTSQAGLCIQFEYDARSGRVLYLKITDSTRTDSKDASETIGSVEKGDLILRDLGYYKLPLMNQIDKTGACYLSRLGSNTCIYQVEKKDQLSFSKIYSFMSRKGIVNYETNIYAGKTERLPCRLVVMMVPEEVYKKRLTEINAKNKEKGYTMAEETKSRLRFNIFITNIAADVLNLDELAMLYKLRWQIELMFKNWKSVCKIDKIQPMKYERFTCILLAKLILIVLDLQIIWKMKSYLYSTTKGSKLLSLYKCFKTLQNKFESIMGIIRACKKDSIEKLNKITNILSSNHWQDPKKNKDKFNLNYEELLDLFICKSK